MVMVIMSKTSFRVKLLNLLKTNSLLLKIFIVFKRHISWVEVIVRRSMGLFEASIFFISCKSILEHSSKVNSRENTVMRHEMVSEVRFIVVQMREASSV